VERLLAQGELEHVPSSIPHSNRLLNESQGHLASARQIVRDDPTGSYQLAYDAARKTCSALLAIQGLRATSRGGHVAVQDVVRHQFGRDFDQFSRMRRRRHQSEYPDIGTPALTTEDADEAIALAERMILAARALIDSGQLGNF
jgi:hypothetical protein